MAAFVEVKGFTYPIQTGGWGYWIRLNFYDGTMANYPPKGPFQDKESAQKECDKAIEVTTAEIEFLFIKNKKEIGIHSAAEIH